MEFEIQRCTRRCVVTDRHFEPGETFYSALFVSGADVERRDYSVEAWSGPPDVAIGWWKSRMPQRDSRRMRWAPNDVMLELLDEMAAKPELADMRYVLALLLVRRRVLRIEEGRHDIDDANGSQLAATEENEKQKEVMFLYCAKNESHYEVAVVEPTPERRNQIQDELSALLFGNATQDVVP